MLWLGSERLVDEVLLAARVSQIIRRKLDMANLNLDDKD